MLELLDRPILYATPERLTPESFWVEHIPFAFWLVDAARPSLIVELGTHVGDSYCAFCQAVAELAYPTRCHAIDTWQGDLHTGPYSGDVLANLRAHHDPRYGSFSRLNQATFDDALGTFANGSIDLLHIDGTHTYEAARHDVEAWLPKVSDRGVILLHDTNVRQKDFGVWRLWSEVRERFPSLEFVHGHGLGLAAAGAKQPAAVAELLTVCRDPGRADAVRRFFAAAGQRIALLRDLRAERERVKQPTDAGRDTHMPCSASDLASLDRSVAALRDEIDAMRNEQASMRAAIGAVGELIADAVLEARIELRGGVIAASDVQAYATEQARYRQAIRDVRTAICEQTPRGARILIVSKGDEELMKTPGRQGFHFPQDVEGGYAGHYPGDDKSAIDHIEDLSRMSFDYLVIPSTSLWWLDYYPGFRAHLNSRFRLCYTAPDVCMIFDLHVERSDG